MKLKIVLAALVGILVLAWSSAEPVPVEPTPNYDATVEARVAQERAVDATVGARAKELVATEQIIEEFQNESHARGLLAQSGYPDWWGNNVDIVGRAKADTTRRFRQHEIAEYLLVKISHDRPYYQSMRYVVDRIDKDGYLMESHSRSNDLIAPGTEVYEEMSFVYSTSEYDKFGPFEYQIRDISSEWWIGNSWDVVEPAIIDDHGDNTISATVTELNPDFNWFHKSSGLQIFGELETPDDIDYFSFEAYGGREFFVFSPRFLPFATDTGGGIPKIAIYGASWFTPLASIGVEEILSYTPGSPGIIYLAVSNSNPGYTGKYRVVVDRGYTSARPTTLTAVPTPTATPTPIQTATPSSDVFELDQTNNGDMYVTNKIDTNLEYKFMCKFKFDLDLIVKYREELDFVNQSYVGDLLEQGTRALTDGTDNFVNAWSQLMEGDPPEILQLRTLLWQELVAEVERVKGIDPESIRYPNATNITSKNREWVFRQGTIGPNRRGMIMDGGSYLCGRGEALWDGPGERGHEGSLITSEWRIKR